MQAQPGGLAPPRPATASGWRSDLLRRGGSAGGTLRRSRWGRWRPTARLRTSLLQASKAPLRGETPLNVGAAAEADAFVCSRAQPDVFGAARMLVVTGSWRKAEWNGRLPMTDHPRFERLQGSAETMHRRYHGGKLVAVILWLADLWMAWRRVGRGRFRSAAHNPDNAQLNVRRARLRMLLTALLMSATVVGIALRAGAADARAGKGLLLPQQHAKAAACPI